jgi:acyl-CoA hydrolase
VTIKASINYTARTSCEVGVKVVAENPLTGEKFHTASAYLTMVGVDKNGKPIPIPQVEFTTDEERHRHLDAGERRKARLALKDSIAQRRATR